MYKIKLKVKDTSIPGTFGRIENICFDKIFVRLNNGDLKLYLAKDQKKNETLVRANSSDLKSILDKDFRKSFEKYKKDKNIIKLRSKLHQITDIYLNDILMLE